MCKSVNTMQYLKGLNLGSVLYPHTLGLNAAYTSGRVSLCCCHYSPPPVLTRSWRRYSARVVSLHLRLYSSPHNDQTTTSSHQRAAYSRSRQMSGFNRCRSRRCFDRLSVWVSVFTLNLNNHTRYMWAGLFFQIITQDWQGMCWYNHNTILKEKKKATTPLKPSLLWTECWYWDGISEVAKRTSTCLLIV